MPFPFSYELKVDTADHTTNSDGRFVKTYHRMYLCKSEVNLTLDAACNWLGILPGAPHPEWPFATARRISPVRLLTREPYCAWEISIDYSTDGVVPEDNFDTAPSLRRVKRRTGTAQQQRFIIKDKNDVLITDAAKSPFDGGVPVTVFLGTVIWDRDEDHTTGSMGQAALYSGKLNSTAFMGCAAYTLMLDVVGEEKWEGQYHYWTFQYTMTYDKDGWRPKPLNAGLWQLVAGVRTRITEEDGSETPDPQPLTTAGVLIPIASRPASCNFVTVDHYETFDFATLGLPTN